MAKWLDGVVVSNQKLNDRLTCLKFNAPLADFQAGQFVRVGLEIDEEIVARPYSLVSLPGEQPLEIYFNIVPKGPLSPKLFALDKGDKILIAPNPNGFLVLNEIPACKNLWMIATGTGVGPFLSILRSEDTWERFEHIVLCYSVRSRDELAYRALIDEIAQMHPTQFRFVPHITREAQPDALQQRIPATIESGELEKTAGVPLDADNSHVMMCGSSEMITDVSALLEARGMRRHRRREPGHFTMEKYH